MTFQSDLEERLAAANRAAGWFQGDQALTPKERQQIDKDAAASTEMMALNFEFPPMANYGLLLGLCRDLIAKHYRYSVEERRVGRTALEFDAQVDPLGPWEVGTRFLVLYAGKPRLMHQHKHFEDLDTVFSEYITAFDSPSREKHCCDVELSTRCRGYLRGPVIPTVFYKTGQFVTIHRCCEKCWNYLESDDGLPNRRRLRQLYRHLDTTPGLRSV